MKKNIKKSNCNCYYGGKLGCKFKKSCNFPNCRFFTIKKPDITIDNYKEYLKIKHESIKLKNALKLKRKEMANRDLDIEACKIFVSPNISLMEQKCCERAISPEIILRIKDIAKEYIRATYHHPKYSSIKKLFPAFVFIGYNLYTVDGTSTRTLYYYNKISQSDCCKMFEANEVTTRKWIDKICRELDIIQVRRKYTKKFSKF